MSDIYTNQATAQTATMPPVATATSAAATSAPLGEPMPVSPPPSSMSSSTSEVPISMLLDLSLPVSIELGRTSMTVQEILRLGRGSVIQLDRLAGEPVDVIVGDRRFAEGEVVILGETFGVRITRILPRTTAEEFAS